MTGVLQEIAARWPENFDSRRRAGGVRKLDANAKPEVSFTWERPANGRIGGKRRKLEFLYF